MVLSKLANDEGKAISQRLMAGLSDTVELRAEGVVQKFTALPFDVGRVAEPHAESQV